MTTTTQSLKPKSTFESKAWLFMRYSSLLLIPLVWFHVLLQDVLVGVHAIDIDYVALRWSSIGIQIYDILLLAFTFAHGMNGLRQVAMDFFHSDKSRRVVSILILVAWLVISVIGGFAIIGGARPELV